MEPQTQPKQQFIKNVFLRIKVKDVIKKWKKLAKKSKQRYYKLREWSDTEQSYCKKLIILRDQVRAPLKQHELISELEEFIMFNNIDGMIQLSAQMKEKIDALVKNWDPIRTVLAPAVQSLSIYLKIYKDYSNNFQKADAIMQQLKQNPQFRQVVKVDYVEDYLIKPVQRPLQYKLFVTDYLKQMPPNHVDRPKLEKALQVLLKIADEINQFVQIQLRAQKLVQLDKRFGDIIESTRVYKSQVQASTADQKCRVYVFNDLLVVSKLIGGHRQELLLRINLCAGSYITKQQDNKIFKNRLYICGSNHSIHLMFDLTVDRDNLFELIKKLISDLYQKQYNREELISKMKIRRETMMIMNRHSQNTEYKWKEQLRYRMRLRVEVVGCEKRLYENQWKIVNVVKIQLGKPQNIYQLAFFQLDQLREIERYISLVHPNMKLLSLDTRYKGMSTDDVKNDFPKYAEYRAIIIEDFLNSLLRCNDLVDRPELVSYRLRIHEALWDYLNRANSQFVAECGCEACLHNEIFTGIDFYDKQRYTIRKKRYQFCILKSFHTQNTIAELVDPKSFKKFSIEQKLLWATCKQKRIDYGVLNREDFGKKVTFIVNLNLIPDDSAIVIKDSRSGDTARQIIEEICERRGIKTSRDLALVYVNDKFEHYLDDDEYVADYVKYLDKDNVKQQIQIKRATRLSIFQTFSKNFDDLGEAAFQTHFNSHKPKIYLRKVFTFSKQEQYKACEDNYERYPILMGQLLKRFKDQLLLLSTAEIKVLCALVYSIEEFHTISFSNKIYVQEEKLKKYLPENKWGFINNQFIEEITSIIQHQAKLCDNIVLLYKLVLKQFGQKQGWATQFFKVKNTQPESLPENSKHLLIGISQRAVIVAMKNNSKNLLQFPISDFNYRISGDSLTVISEQKTYTFVGSNLMLFDNLIKKFKLIYDFQRSS